MEAAYTLRAVEEQEWLAYGRAMATVFHEPFDDDKFRLLRAAVDLDRFVAVDAPDGALVGTAGALALPMAMAGAPFVDCAAVTAVTVRPDHRRRGLLTAMMQRLLEDARAAGEPVAALFASEGRIYGRYGFGPAAPRQVLRVARSALATVDGDASAVRVVDATEAKRHLPAIEAVHARLRCGTLQRTPAFVDLWLDRDQDADEGYAARWHAVVPERGHVVFRVRDGDWADRRPGATLKVEELLATDVEARASLWAFLGSMDLVTTVVAPGRPIDDPLPHLVAAESDVDTTPDLALWVRLVDLPAALTARPYHVTDRVVFEVDDPQLPHNTGRWLLDVAPGAATCEPTDRPPDVTLPTGHLATLFLGGVAATRLADAGRLRGTGPEIVRRLDRLFAAPRAPWHSFDF